MKYRICDKCKAFIEEKKETVFEGGTSYIQLVCPKCGNVKKTTINHVHYGQDGI